MKHIPRLCPNCGATVAPEARFCRLCGTPLKAVGGGDTDSVSPRAQTVPLSDEGRTTHSLSGDDRAPSASDTHKVGRAEMDSILRRSRSSQPTPQQANGAHAVADGETYAAPPTARLQQPLDGAPANASASLAGSESASQATESAKESAAKAAASEKSVTADRARSKTGAGSRRRWQVAAIALLFVAVGASVLAFYYSRRTGREDAGGAPPISISDQKRLVEERLSEAERLLASGNTTEAIARLRYAVKLDPTNARAHSMLGQALERTGAVTEAIDEYRIAAQYDPSDEQVRLRYADALRRTGRTDEAREVYQKLSSSSSEEVARTAREQLAQLPAQASTANAADGRDTRAGNGQQNRAADSPADASGASPQGSPLAQATTPTNGAGATSRPQNNPDADYSEATKIIEGKDIKKMSRAELLRAYELFQRAQAGANGAAATRRVQQLDKELFERRRNRRQ